jgi:2-methylisocitrate lyase-like PEP mutase family enzyme
MSSSAEKATRFETLHQRDVAFVIPNPWDLGSARILAELGFEALATTSAGFAHTLGRLDGTLSFEEKLEHCRALAEFSPLPVNGDLENCFADDPAQAAANLLRFAQTGLSGGSIEDFSQGDGGTGSGHIYSIEHATERVAAAVELLTTLDRPFVITARAENLIRGVKDLDDTIRRLQAFEKAGAHVLYAPGLTTLEEVREVTSAVSLPVNVLAPPMRGISVAQMSEAGAVRISVGGALARAAIGALIDAAREMQDDGTFDWTGRLASGRDLAKLLG